MNTSLFIAKRLLIAKEENNRYTRPIIRIAILAIALSVAVMLLTIIVVNGFRNEVEKKVIGFGSHIQITAFTDNKSYESQPIEKSKLTLERLHASRTDRSDSSNLNTRIANVGIKHMQVFATKAGIIKTVDQIHPVVLKGFGSDFDPSFFIDNLVEGSVPIFNDTITSNEILISRKVSNTLELKLKDKLDVYFVQDPPRVRRFSIRGIYETGLVDFDNLIVLADIRHIQKLNGWNIDQVGGFEIELEDFSKIDEKTSEIYDRIPYNLNAQSIKDLNPQVFDWLALQKVNVRVILILMFIVAIMNIITCLLILVLERTAFIGVIKTLGADNWLVRKVFMYNAMYLVYKGLLWGNIIGLGIAYIQHRFNLFSLDPNIYYMDSVPTFFSFFHILSLNLCVIFVCWLMLLIPTLVVSKIKPVKSISFS